MKSGYSPDRREFLRSLGRKLALGGLLAGTTVLVGKPGKRNHKCTSDGICTRCSVLADCGLPQALSAKQAVTGE